jgi:hypothetical protein
MHVQEILSTHPQKSGTANKALIRCIEECYDCAQVCISCADASVGEDRVKTLIQCIRLCLDCADVCTATGTLASRQTGNNEAVVESMLDACIQACHVCGEECVKHASMHRHCKVCAEECQRCEEACRSVRSMASAPRP